MKTLVVVDFQRDFYHPDGLMYVKGAEDAEDAIVDYINKHASELSDVVFTVDWHSPKHCSFKKNGGEWPVHCVQFSEGAGISDKLMNICMYYDINIKVFRKGNVRECEEYGAFDYVGSYTHQDGNVDIVINNMAHNNSQYFDTANIVVCGLAGDYCVKESIKNLLNYKGPVDMQLSVLKDGVASIDGGKAFNEFIVENNIKTV